MVFIRLIAGSYVGRWAGYEILQKLNRGLGFEPLSNVDAERLESEARQNSCDEALDRQICAVTDAWVYPKNAVRVELNALPFRAMKATLTGGSWRTQAISDYYDCSTIHDGLAGLLLSRKAFLRGDDGEIYVWIENAAYRYLGALEARLVEGGIAPGACKPPKFAIADGFVAGVFEEIDATNYIERQTIGLVQIRGIVKVVYGGPGNVINSHLICWDNREATIASRVPSVVSRENFHVILAGPMTSAQEVLLAKRHECSGERVRRAHDRLRHVNPLYADVGINEELRASCRDSTSITTRLEEDDETQQLIAQARARQVTVTRDQNVPGNDTIRECTVVESHTILMDTIADQSEQDRLARAVANVAPRQNAYVARRSTTILQTTDPHYMERLFPHLLTFGVGGLSTARHHRYSSRAIVLHYLNLSSNRFAEDTLFKLVMFDFLSTQRVKSGVFLRVGQDPSLATTAMRVSPNQLKSAMRSRAEQRASWRAGRSYSPSPQQSSADTLLKSINAATSKMWGSNEERVAGLPKTQSDWDRLLASDDIRRKFEQYCASIFSAELPVYDSVESLRCLRADCDGQLAPTPISRSFKHLQRAPVAAPDVAKCDTCGKGFSEADVTRSVIEEQWCALSEENKAISTEGAVKRIRYKFCGLSRHRKTANVQMSRLLLLDQVHAWGHTYSCVKGGGGTKCRYRFFRKLVSATGLNSNNEIVFRRRVGNQWLNPFVNLWRRVLHFNMDARVLWSGDSLQAARYALQYALKRQSVLDNVAVVDMAFKRRVSREMALQTTVYAQGIGRLLSLAYASSGVMEIGGPLATAILHEGDAVTFSCVFERLVLLEGLNLLNNVVVEATVVSRNHQMFAETSISRYLQRPKCLDDMCWYDFCSWISRVESFAAREYDQCAFHADDSREFREHLRRHAYRYLDYPRVPEIIGPRMPDASRLANDDYCEQTELYYRMAALLYHPFRDVCVFLDANASARTHFDRWMASTDTDVARHLEYHQQYYIGLQKAQEYRAKQRSSEDSSDEDEVFDDEDVITDIPIRQSAVSRSSLHYEEVPPEFYAADADVVMDSGAALLVSGNDDSPFARLLHDSISTARLPVDECFGLTIASDVVRRSHIRMFEKQNQHVNATSATTSQNASIPVGTAAVTVEALHRAVSDLSYKSHGRLGKELDPLASIQDVSVHFGLNRLQHAAFTLIAVPLLKKITGIAFPGTDNSLFDESPVIITGAGGTGKSQIISAVRALAASWNQPRAVDVVASTGIVAASLRGSTMHSSVGLKINPKVVPKSIMTPSDAMLEQWAPVHCVIADEVSMIDLGFFGIWEESLQYLREDRQRDYGGLLAVLMFDHCKLRCIKGMPMFKTSASLTPAQSRGMELYRKITKVIYLTENMRFSQDPKWGTWLASGRLGCWPDDCRAYITSLPRFQAGEAPDPEGQFKTISTDNSTRAVTNDTAIRMAVRCFGLARKIYVIPAQFSRPTIPTEVALLRQLPDNKTGNIPLFLRLYIGMPVRVKANQCMLKGVANGAAATVRHIDWEANTAFSLQNDGTWLASLQPRNIYVDVANCPSPVRFPGIPNDWPASVMPVYQATASIEKMVPPLSIKGFPLVPAFGTTVHGVQGETLDVVAVTNLRPPHVTKVDKHALYVALSRLRTRHGLHWVGPPPTDADFDFFQPDPDVIEEDDRLKRLSGTTLTLFDRTTARLTP